MKLKSMIAGIALTGAAVTGATLAGTASAETRVTLKSAKSTSSYYVMMVQLAEMMKQASNGTYVPTVEESQGSVQNVKESRVRPGNFLFTTPPNLLAAARAGKKPFDDGAFDTARTLFVMPFVTIHFVVRDDAGIRSMTDLAGRTFIAGGKGSFCEGRSKKILEALGLIDKVKLVDVELSAAGPAMRNGKVDGFSTCSSHPTPQLVELATTTPVSLLQFTDAERQKIIDLDPLSGPISIAAGTYKGQGADINTVGVPVGAYGTTNMSDDAAYFITKTFWEWKDRLGKEQPWWNGVNMSLVGQLGARVHPGALRYYTEKGVSIPASMK